MNTGSPFMFGWWQLVLLCIHPFFCQRRIAVSKSLARMVTCLVWYSILSVMSNLMFLIMTWVWDTICLPSLCFWLFG